jgi:hypothetical protein
MARLRKTKRDLIKYKKVKLGAREEEIFSKVLRYNGLDPSISVRKTDGLLRDRGRSIYESGRAPDLSLLYEGEAIAMIEVEKAEDHDHNYITEFVIRGKEERAVIPKYFLTGHMHLLRHKVGYFQPSRLLVDDPARVFYARVSIGWRYMVIMDAPRFLDLAKEPPCQIHTDKEYLVHAPSDVQYVYCPLSHPVDVEKYTEDGDEAHLPLYHGLLEYLSAQLGEDLRRWGSRPARGYQKTLAAINAAASTLDWGTLSSPPPASARVISLRDEILRRSGLARKRNDG